MDRRPTGNLSDIRGSSVDRVNLADYISDSNAPAGAALQKALDTGRSVFVPSGTYILDQTVSFTTAGQVLYGEGANKTRFVSTITDGSATIDTSGFDRIEIHSLSIYGQTQTSPYQNTIGLHLNASTRSFLFNVSTRYCAKGMHLEDSWILSAINLYARDCGVGLHLDTVNNVDMSIRLASNGQPFIIDGCGGGRFDVLTEGTPPTSSSTIDNAHGLSFSSFYTEFNTSGSVAEVAIGGVTGCVGINFEAVNAARENSNVPLFAFDDVNGGFVGSGHHGGGTAGNVYTITANTRNVVSRLLPPLSSQGAMLPPPTLMNRTIYNLFPDPYFASAIPTWDVQQDVTASEETSVVPEGMRRAVALLVGGDGTFAYVQKNFNLAIAPYNELLGQKCGVAAMVYAPNTVNFGVDLPRCSLYADVNGTGGTPTPTRNRDYIPGQWVLTWNELDIPADATQLDFRVYANQSSTNVSGDTVYVGACFIWLGGSKNVLKLFEGDLIPRTP